MPVVLIGLQGYAGAVSVVYAGAVPVVLIGLQGYAGGQHELLRALARPHQPLASVAEAQAARSLWEVLHELGHALHLLLSCPSGLAFPTASSALWPNKAGHARGGQTHSSGAVATKAAAATASPRSPPIRFSQPTHSPPNSHSQPPRSSPASRSQPPPSPTGSYPEAPQSPAARLSELLSSVAPSGNCATALWPTPTEWPLELLELPSTLLELMATQPSCVEAILAHAMQQGG